MVATTPPEPPEGRTGVTYAEIAAHYGLAPRYVAENPRWGRHPSWPPRVAKRGRNGEFDPQAVHSFVQDHHARQVPTLDPQHAYTVAEIATATGLAADTIYADISRGRWPEPDRTTPDGVRTWHGSTITTALAGRRGYRQSGDATGT
ncbi:helix-turn-helix transcriptional regulator [Streptomyces sp. NPDC001493]